MIFLRLYVLRTFWYTSVICIVYSNLKDSSRPKNLIKSWTFTCNFFYNIRHGLQRIDELNSIFGDEASSRTSVYRWYSEFNRGRSSPQDEFRKGRLKSVVILETIDAVCQQILQDRHMTYREIETTLGISGTSMACTFDCQKNLFALDPTNFVNRSKKSINQNDKSALTIGSNACKSA